MGRSKATYASLFALAMLPAVAHAADVSRAQITVVQDKPVLRAGRLMLTPEFGMTVSDPLLKQYVAAGSLTWFANENHAASARFEWFDFGDALGGTTDAYDDVISTMRVAPAVAPLDWYAGADYSWSPGYGKAAVFKNLISFYDLYGTAGLGVVHAGGETSPAGDLALGTHLFLHPQLALTLETRDRIQYRPIGGKDAWMQTISLGFGVSVFLSPTPRVHEED